MPKLPLPLAARELGIAYSTLHRRMNVVGLESEVDEHGATFVDTDELVRLWEARPRSKRPRAPRGRGGLVNVIVDEATREELDSIAEAHDVSLAEATRHILSYGLVSYYDRGRVLEDV